MPIQAREGLRLAKCFALRTWERNKHSNETGENAQILARDPFRRELTPEELHYATTSSETLLLATDDEHAELASSMHVSAKEMRSFVLQLLVWLLRHLQADSLGSSHAAAAVAYTGMLPVN
jgi:hypothetical protein